MSRYQGKAEFVYREREIDCILSQSLSDLFMLKLN